MAEHPNPCRTEPGDRRCRRPESPSLDRREELMSQHPFITFHVPFTGEEEINEVIALLRSAWLATGAHTAQFEKDSLGERR
jgi:hypothetical protein